MRGKRNEGQSKPRTHAAAYIRSQNFSINRSIFPNDPKHDLEDKKKKKKQMRAETACMHAKFQI